MWPVVRLLSFLGSPLSATVTVRTVVSVGKKVVEVDELGAANGASELLAGGVLGAGAIFVAALGTNAVSVAITQGHPIL